jgi:hypothetical protein
MGRILGYLDYTAVDLMVLAVGIRAMLSNHASIINVPVIVVCND